MKNDKKRIAAFLTVVTLLTALLLAGCVDRTAAENVPAETEKYGVYVRLERGDVSFIYLRGGSFSTVGKNADGSLLSAGEWMFTGDDIAQLSRAENRAILFTVGAGAADDTTLAEASFYYDAALERLYVTIGEDGVTCATSDAPDAPADVTPVLTLPILDEIDSLPAGAFDSAQSAAVQAAVSLLTWGASTGLGAEEISEAASTWLAERTLDLTDCQNRLAQVDSAYQTLLTDDARKLLDSAGFTNIQITWGHEPIASVEAIMQAAGLRN